LNLSFIIPTFNRKEFTAQLIRRVMDERIPDSEILVIDDCSDDGTPGFLSGLFPGIRVLVNARRSFPAHSRNVGIKESRADTLVFIDSDISFEGGALKEFLRGLKGDSFNFPLVRWVDGSEMPEGTTSVFAFKKELLSGFNGNYFDENIGVYGEDTDFFYKAKILRLELSFNKKAVFVHGKPNDTLPENYSLFRYYMCYRNALYLSLKYLGLVKKHSFAALVIGLVKYCGRIILNILSFNLKKAVLLFLGITWNLANIGRCAGERRMVKKLFRLSRRCKN
jgi:glycosyltransferase involved in cell wall biosynthesis